MPSVSSIPIWGWGDVISTLLVLIGVVWETEWTSKGKKTPAILLAIGVAGELICVPFSIYDSAQLNKEAGDAREQAAKASEQAANLEKEDQDLKDSLGWRSFPKGLLSLISGDLAMHPGEVTIEFYDEPETRNLTKQLSDTFLSAKWKVSSDATGGRKPRISHIHFRV